MLLEDKNAVIYGAGGGSGGAVARAFAREGADVFLTGRTRELLRAVAADVAGGRRVRRGRRWLIWSWMRCRIERRRSL